VKIFVAVADVDALVKKGSAIDEHARFNTTSVYTSAKVFPMLPESLSTDLTSLGEEATHIGAAHALRDGDWMFPAYREAGAALYRGYPLPTFMCQLFGNADDPVKGRQMPVHHSVRRCNFVSVSSPVGSHIPHASARRHAEGSPRTRDLPAARRVRGRTRGRYSPAVQNRRAS
jgi:hypothetical protein